MPINNEDLKVIKIYLRDGFGSDDLDLGEATSDGGYETVGLMVTDINGNQFETLKNVSNQVRCKVAMAHCANGIRICFY